MPVVHPDAPRVYRAKPPADDDDELALRRRVDELYTAHPAAAVAADDRNAAVGRPGASTACGCGGLMRHMTIAVLYSKPRTTKPAPGHNIYPYLLRDDG